MHLNFDILQKDEIERLCQLETLIPIGVLASSKFFLKQGTIFISFVDDTPSQMALCIYGFARISELQSVMVVSVYSTWAMTVLELRNSSTT